MTAAQIPGKTARASDAQPKTGSQETLYRPARGHRDRSHPQKFYPNPLIFLLRDFLIRTVTSDRSGWFSDWRRADSLTSVDRWSDLPNVVSLAAVRGPPA
jgi:hypothetical protein